MKKKAIFIIIIIVFLIAISIWLFFPSILKNQQSEEINSTYNIQSNISTDCCTAEQKAEGYVCIRCGGPPVKRGEPYVGGGNWCVRQRSMNETFPGDPQFVCPT